MLEDKLRELQKRTMLLDSCTEDRILLQNLAVEYANRFYDSQPEQKAYQAFDESVKTLLNEPIKEESEEAETILHQIENTVVNPGLNTVSGRHFGYIPGGGLASSAVGDFLAAVTNRYAGVYASSPGAVLIETRLINWLAELIGYGEQAGGYLSSGGSHANLTALVTARDQAGLKGTDFSKAVIYLTKQTHHCVDRALNIAGMKECRRRYIPMDHKFRMIPDKLIDYIQKDRRKGLIPWTVVASAGSTDTGAVDPLAAIGQISKEQELWYQIDAAYGGFFILTDDGKKKLSGIEMSDSVVMDPHKGLFLPYGTGALIVKNVSKLAESNHFKANYMKDANIRSGIYSPAELSPELSKHFRGLRMWIPLKLHGVKRFREALKEKQLLAEFLWKEMSDMDEIEVGPEPSLSIFMFRWKPTFGNANTLNEKLHKLILKDGRVFLSTTTVDGKFYFRIAILSVRTHLKEVNELIEIVREKMGELKKEYNSYSNPS